MAQSARITLCMAASLAPSRLMSSFHEASSMTDEPRSGECAALLYSVLVHSATLSAASHILSSQAKTNVPSGQPCPSCPFPLFVPRWVPKRSRHIWAPARPRRIFSFSLFLFFSLLRDLSLFRWCRSLSNAEGCLSGDMSLLTMSWSSTSPLRATLSGTIQTQTCRLAGVGMICIVLTTAASLSSCVAHAMPCRLTRPDSLWGKPSNPSALVSEPQASDEILRGTRQGGSMMQCPVKQNRRHFRIEEP